MGSSEILRRVSPKQKGCATKRPACLLYATLNRIVREKYERSWRPLRQIPYERHSDVIHFHASPRMMLQTVLPSLTESEYMAAHINGGGSRFLKQSLVLPGRDPMRGQKQ